MIEPAEATESTALQPVTESTESTALQPESGATRADLLRSTALRWCVPHDRRPAVDQEWPTQPQSLSLTLDLFLEHHLPWLPVPRYSPQAIPYLGITDEDIFLCLADLCAACGADIEAVEVNSLETMEAAALWACPLIEILRSTDTPDETAAVLCTLLALDPKSANQVTRRTAESTTFVSKALAVIGEELRLTAPADPREGLVIAHEYLQKKAIQVACIDLPPAGPKWMPYSEAEDKYYMPHKAAVDAKLQTLADDTGLSLEFLKLRCRIQSLVAEEPVLGFDHP